MSGISPEPYFQNLVGEHSAEGDPASLYSLTKSDPDPLSNDQQYYTAMIHYCYAYAATHNVMHSKKIFLNHPIEH